MAGAAGGGRRSGPRSKDSELRVRGLGLAARFALTTSLSLTLVVLLAGFLLYKTLTDVAEGMHRRQINRAVRLSAELHEDGDVSGDYSPLTQRKVLDQDTGVENAEVMVGPERQIGAVLYQYRSKAAEERKEEPFRLFLPALDTTIADNVLGLLVGVLVAVVLVGAFAAIWAAAQVTRPIHQIVDAVRLIAKGDLSHRVHVRGGGAEVELLARALGRMAGDLEVAQEAEVELSVREREMGVATEVREALLPRRTPDVSGYEITSAHLPSSKPGGDFHDFLPLPDGRLGLLVCDVSGQGVPAALVGATARSYLRSELVRGGDLAEAFGRVNAELARDVRRGMFVTAYYLLLDPRDGRARAVSAGHKVPLIRHSAADGSLRMLHPEGIALGLDKGPVFERALKVQETFLEPGDRLVLTTSGPLRARNARGEELGEKRFYALILKLATGEPERFLERLRESLAKFSAEGSFPQDVSLITVRRAPTRPSVG